MAYDELLAARIREALAGGTGITERKMFGGLAFLSHGRMCCGIVRCDLMVRVPAEAFEALLRKRHARPMDFTGKPLRGFLFVSPSGCRTDAALRTWLAYGQQAAGEMDAQPRARRTISRQKRIR
jgi:TfoX/Sxy family transcriptional regulator of competence genes